MRVIAGEYKNLELEVPKSGTRPTTSKLKEAVFSSLESRGAVEGRVLDLFAGSGALGFEALSRGADFLTVVDCSREAVKCLKKNAAPFKEGGRGVEVIPMKAEKFLEGCRGKFDLIFLDPPYGMGSAEFGKILSGSTNLLSPGGYIVAEREKEDFLPSGLKAVKTMKSGSTTCEILLKEAEENGKF
ncbi:MAG: 16S rRNA (guanine(966)-N(2))-methyltransferase RsmD [Aeriscardovia sp.]|nr:16S rRNA (guanine(966)-N(2))-methyltransferase RsmD [Aeriscardovia sp.]